MVRAGLAKPNPAPELFGIPLPQDPLSLPGISQRTGIPSVMKKIHNALNADHFTRITCSNYNQISLEQNGVKVHRQRSAFSALAEA